MQRKNQKVMKVFSTLHISLIQNFLEPQLIAKSNVILDIKPWDDETDMKKMEEHVRKIECDGLLWGAAKLVPLAYGIRKLQISCVVEDEKVSIDWLTEQLQEIEDYVRNVNNGII